MTPDSAIAHRVVAEARLWLGTPYRHQASRRGVGCDCLGLVRGVWRAVIGPEPEPVPPYSRDWSEVAGREDLLAAAMRWLQPAGRDPQVGHVLVFRMRDGAVAKHLGIAAERNGLSTVIHAYSGHGVVESPLSGSWARRIVACHQFPNGE